MEQIFKIFAFMLSSFVHIWPYLLISIPLAVAVKYFGAARNINKLLSKNPFVSIILATAIGAISPFCSCGVIPVIASLLISGVPLAPVMSFWIASPSMDPEIFMLSVATIGWKLSVWRLTATFIISLLSGFITHFAVKKGFFGTEILRKTPVLAVVKTHTPIFIKLIEGSKKALNFIVKPKTETIQLLGVNNSKNQKTIINCCITMEDSTSDTSAKALNLINPCTCEASQKTETGTPLKKLIIETWKAFWMVTKFMAIAFFINALINFYLPDGFLTGLLGNDNQLSVLLAALVGIPFYTSNLTALPVVSGLISLGMNPGAALSFLIAGPVTTLPAMMAVWGIVRPRVFFMYLLFSFAGAIVFGYLYNFIN